MRYRRKLDLVDAYQFQPAEPLPDDVRYDERLAWYYVRTQSGSMRIEPGDWVLTQSDGTRFRLRPAIFEQQYEPVEGSPT